MGNLTRILTLFGNKKPPEWAAISIDHHLGEDAGRKFLPD
jgi:hypothetical protein